MGQGHLDRGGAEGAMAFQLFQNRRIFGNFNVSSENFGLFLLVKIKVSNFIRKSLNLAPLRYRRHETPEMGAKIVIMRLLKEVSSF